MGNEEVPISHLQYVDDTLIFGEWNVANAKNLMRILECLQQASGLKINSNKSKVYGIVVSNMEVDFIANRMGCSPGKMPFTYLGIPIGTNMRRISSWNGIIDKFKKRLSLWKARTLSFGGRLTLVKSVLGSISLFRAPMEVIKKLESLRQRFFWGGTDEVRKIAWVKWDKAPQKVKLGGLNIGSLKAINWALLAKWWWRFRVEENRPWVKIIKSVYGENGGLIETGRYSRSGGSKWADIVKVGGDIEKTGLNFCSSFGKLIGNGDKTRFWLDSWTGGGVVLSEKFPRLYRLESNINITVGEMREWNGVEWVWVGDG